MACVEASWWSISIRLRPPEGIEIAHHLIIRSLGLAVTVAELPNGVQVELVRVLEDDPEATLIVIRLASILTQRDNDFFLYKRRQIRC